jgi:nicotinate-nucleotide--dimethylbenzimidazole phosphoribosyltransferase
MFQESPAITGALKSIRPLDRKGLNLARRHLDSLLKPPGRLGHLEDLASRLAALNAGRPPDVSRRCVVVLAADNGVVAEGVSSAPQTVTAQQTLNILEGLAGVSVLSRQFRTDLKVVDVGVAVDLEHPALIRRKIRYATGNIAREPAMSRTELTMAVETGLSLADVLKREGYQAIGVGEMGIGNTTTSSADLAALLVCAAAPRPGRSAAAPV